MQSDPTFNHSKAGLEFSRIGRQSVTYQGLVIASNGGIRTGCDVMPAANERVLTECTDDVLIDYLIMMRGKLNKC